MECLVESQPGPKIKWFHGTTPIDAGGRFTVKLDPKAGDTFTASLMITDPTATDGGAYKCTAGNEYGESNANINLNFAGPDEEKTTVIKGPTFVGKPKIIPKDGGAVILLECRVRSPTSKPTAVWTKSDQPVREGGRVKIVFNEEGENVYLCQLEIKVRHFQSFRGSI